MGTDDEDIQETGVQAPIRPDHYRGVNPLFNLELLFKMAAYPKARGAPPRGWKTQRMFSEGEYIEARDFLMKLPKPETSTKVRSLFLVRDVREGHVLFFSDKKKKGED